MTTVMPISDLQRNIKAVAQACAETQEPVYLTRNGYPALVIMDAETYEKEKSLKQLIYERERRIYEKALAGHEQTLNGDVVSLAEARALKSA